MSSSNDHGQKKSAKVEPLSKLRLSSIINHGQKIRQKGQTMATKSAKLGLCASNLAMCVETIVKGIIFQSIDADLNNLQYMYVYQYCLVPLFNSGKIH